ncbi:MAG: SEC-C domain-containing protein [Candidatus Solibacter usitatus]|nr:SEC-C domain-containing protein [Candidatus Solibacter usitatus]
MASTAQVLANHANAQLSTGPRTAEGKAASSRNRVSHGLFASFDNLSPQDRAIFDEFRAYHVEQWQPHTPEMEYWVSRVALADFRIDRVQSLDRGIYAIGVAKLREEGNTSNLITLEAQVFLDDCKSAKAISRLMRWERLFLRDRDKAIAILTNIIECENQAKAAADPNSFQNRRASFPTAPLFAKTNPIPPQPAPVQSVPLTPRSAPCPCGSGQKFKRCCGKDAPAVLTTAA